MSIQSAIDLIKNLDNAADLRLKMYSCNSANELEQCLVNNGFQFSYNELDEAVNSLHVKCQTVEEAQDLMHKAEWVKYILLHIKK